MKYEYYGATVSEDMSKFLLQHFGHLIPDGWKPFAHHMTIIHSSRPNAELEAWAEEHLNQTVELEVNQIGISEAAIALKVSGGAPSANARPHITLAVAPKAKPVQSNQIEDWQNISPMTFPATITRY